MSGQNEPANRGRPATSKPARRPSDAIFEALRLDIAVGRLKPRERLIEHDLCQRFGTSNHNVRHAFELLDRVGLIDRRANRGVEVKALTGQELSDLYEIRLVLQREGALKIDMARRGALVHRLEQINARYEAALDEHDVEAAVVANDAFHMATFDFCLNAELASLQRIYWLKASAIISRVLTDKTLADVSRRDHADIIAALRKGDTAALVDAAVRHVRPAVDAYRRIYGLADEGMIL